MIWLFVLEPHTSLLCQFPKVYFCGFECVCICFACVCWEGCSETFLGLYLVIYLLDVIFLLSCLRAMAWIIQTLATKTKKKTKKKHFHRWCFEHILYSIINNNIKPNGECTVCAVHISSNPMVSVQYVPYTFLLLCSEGSGPFHSVGV